MAYAPTLITYKDAGGTSRNMLTLADGTTFLMPTAITDELGNFIASTNGTNGRGLNVVNLADSAIKGVHAHDTAISTPPALIGGEAIASTAALTLVTTTRATRLAATLDQKLITMPWGAPNDFFNSRPVSSAADTADHTLVAAGAAGVRLVPMALRVSNASATATEIVLKDGTAGTTIDRVGVGANQSVAVFYGTGLWDTTAATLLCFASLVGAATVFVSVNGLRSKL